MGISDAESIVTTTMMSCRHLALRMFMVFVRFVLRQIAAAFMATLVCTHINIKYHNKTFHTAKTKHHIKNWIAIGADWRRCELIIEQP